MQRKKWSRNFPHVWSIRCVKLWNVYTIMHWLQASSTWLEDCKHNIRTVRHPMIQFILLYECRTVPHQWRTVRHCATIILGVLYIEDACSSQIMHVCNLTSSCGAVLLLHIGYIIQATVRRTLYPRPHDASVRVKPIFSIFPEFLPCFCFNQRHILSKFVRDRDITDHNRPSSEGRGGV